MLGGWNLKGLPAPGSPCERIRGDTVACNPGRARLLLRYIALCPNSRTQVNHGPTREALAGTVERVTFHNGDTGLAALPVKVRGLGHELIKG